MCVLARQYQFKLSSAPFSAKMPGRESLPRLAKDRSTYGNPQAIASKAAAKKTPQTAPKKKSTATAKPPKAQPQAARVTKTKKTAPKRPPPKKPAQGSRGSALQARVQTPYRVQKKKPSAAPDDDNVDDDDEDGSSESRSPNQDNDDEDVVNTPTAAPAAPAGPVTPTDGPHRAPYSGEEDSGKSDPPSKDDKDDKDDKSDKGMYSPLAMPSSDDVERPSADPENPVTGDAEVTDMPDEENVEELSTELETPANYSDEVNESSSPLRTVMSGRQGASQPPTVPAAGSTSQLPFNSSRRLSVPRPAHPRPRSSDRENVPPPSEIPIRSIEVSLPRMAESMTRAQVSGSDVQRGSREPHVLRARNPLLERVARSTGPSPEAGRDRNLGRLSQVPGLSLPTPEDSSRKPAAVPVSQPREMPVFDADGFQVETVRPRRQNVTWAPDPDGTGFFVETIQTLPEPRVATPGASTPRAASDGDGPSGDETSPSLRTSSRRRSAAQSNPATVGSEPVHSLPIRTAPANTDPGEEPHQTQPPLDLAQLEAHQRFWRAEASKTWYALQECTDITDALARRCRWEPRHAALTALEFVLRGYDYQTPHAAGVSLDAIDYDSGTPALLRERELHWMHYLTRPGYQPDNNRLIGVFEKSCESAREIKIMWAINRKADGLLDHDDQEEIFSTIEKWTKVDDFIERLNTHCQCCTGTVRQEFTKSQVLKAIKLMVIRGQIR